MKTEQLNLLSRVVYKVVAERKRQEQLLADGKIVGDCKHPAENEWRKFTILGEEFGEVAEAVLESSRSNRASREHMLTELIQTAAVACAWAEALEKELYG